MKVSGFLTQVRNRFQTQETYVRWSDTQELLNTLEQDESASSLASLSSDISTSMRECLCISSPRLCENADIKNKSDLARFHAELTQLFIEVNAELSDSCAPQYYDVDERIASLQADTKPSIDKLISTAMKIPNLLSVSSRLYQQEGRSQTLQQKALSILTRLCQTTREMLRACSSFSAATDRVRFAHATCSSSKAWLQYQLSDSACLATLNNAKNILESRDLLDQDFHFLATKNEALSIIKTWLAVFQLDERFCPLASPLHTVRLDESLSLLKECLLLLEPMQQVKTSDERASGNSTAIEILIADTMLKINHLLAKKGLSEEAYSVEHIVNVISPLYNLNTQLFRKELICGDALGVAYILTRLSFESPQMVEPKKAQKVQRTITRIYEEDGASVPDNGINSNKRAKAQYARELFSSMNQGHTHWMNLVACSREPGFQFNEMMPTIDRSSAKAMF